MTKYDVGILKQGDRVRVNDRAGIRTLNFLVRCAGRLLWVFVPFAKCPKCQRWTWWERHLWQDGDGPPIGQDATCRGCGAEWLDGLFWSGWNEKHDTPNAENQALTRERQ